jgi:hypothetical protein
MKRINVKFGQRRQLIFLGALLLINLTLFYIPNVPGSIPNILQYAADSSTLTIPDMKFYSDIDEIYTFLADITQEGRHAYQIMHWTTDLAFPILYALFLFSLTARNLLTADVELQKKKPSNLLPFLALIPAGFDLIENFILLYITKHFPEYFGVLMSALRLFTAGKFFFLFVNLTLILYLVIKNRINKNPYGKSPSIDG